MTLDLNETEVQAIVDHIANTMPWARANPILMKITQQAQAQGQQGQSLQQQARNGGDAAMREERP